MTEIEKLIDVPFVEGGKVSLSKPLTISFTTNAGIFTLYLMYLRDVKTDEYLVGTFLDAYTGGPKRPTTLTKRYDKLNSAAKLGARAVVGVLLIMPSLRSSHFYEGDEYTILE